MKYIFISLLFIEILFCIAILASSHTARKRKNVFLLGTFLLVIFSLCRSILLYDEIPRAIAIGFPLAISVSFCGDLLMDQRIRITSKKLIDGMIGFSLAHIIFVITILMCIDYQELEIIDYIITAVLFVLGIMNYLIFLKPENKKNFEYAVLGYSFLLLMTFSVCLLVFLSQNQQFMRFPLLIGAVLFVISDSGIAYREFKNRFTGIDSIILITYLLAQTLLQISPTIS